MNTAKCCCRRGLNGAFDLWTAGENSNLEYKSVETSQRKSYNGGLFLFVFRWVFFFFSALLHFASLEIFPAYLFSAYIFPRLHPRGRDAIVLEFFQLL